MKRNILILLMSMTVTAIMANPLLGKYKTPYGTIPFNSIETKHYLRGFSLYYLKSMMINRGYYGYTEN